MLDDDNLLLDSQLCFALYAATHAITRAYRTQLKHVGLTYPQYLVMLALWERDGQTVNELAQRLNLDSGTLTPLLKRLENAALVRRQRNTQDERAVNVFLTTKANAIKQDVAAIQHQIACQTRLESAEFAALRTQLHQLARTFAGGDGSPRREGA